MDRELGWFYMWVSYFHLSIGQDIVGLFSYIFFFFSGRWSREDGERDFARWILFFYARVLYGGVYRSPQPEAVKRHTNQDGRTYPFLHSI